MNETIQSTCKRLFKHFTAEEADRLLWEMMYATVCTEGADPETSGQVVLLQKQLAELLPLLEKLVQKDYPYRIPASVA